MRSRLVSASELLTCVWSESRWTRRAQVNMNVHAQNVVCVCGHALMRVCCRSWCHWLRLSAGRGGTPNVGLFSQRLRLSGAVRRSLHLRQRRSEKGHRLSAVRRLQEEVRFWHERRSATEAVPRSVCRAENHPVRRDFLFCRLPDGLTRRGDINLLMLGDPGTAKSQLLKFVERCSPIGVRTSVCVFRTSTVKEEVSCH